MKKFLVSFFIFFFLSFSKNSIAQNKYSEEGLKIGYWVEYDPDLKSTSIGNYKIVPDSYFSIRKEADNYFFSRNKIEERFDSSLIWKKNLLSVPDGLWRSFDPLGRIESESWIINGIRLKHTYFDSLGVVTEKGFTDTINAISYYDKYLKGHVVERFTYSKSPSVKSGWKYFPDDSIYLLENQLFFQANFFYHPYDTSSLVLYSNSEFPVKINTIKTLNNQVEIFDSKYHTFSATGISILPFDSLKLNFVFKPDINRLNRFDSLLIFFDSALSKPIEISILELASHIDMKVTRMNDTLTISKKEIPKLICASVGRNTDVILFRIDGPKKKQQEYYFKPYKEIDLSEFEDGYYLLEMISCDFAKIKIHLID